MRTQTKATQAALTPQGALELLREGNARLQANLNLLEQANITADGQYPFAVILSCIDSRVGWPSKKPIYWNGICD